MPLDIYCIYTQLLLFLHFTPMLLLPSSSSKLSPSKQLTSQAVLHFATISSMFGSLSLYVVIYSSQQWSTNHANGVTQPSFTFLIRFWVFRYSWSSLRVWGFRFTTGFSCGYFVLKMIEFDGETYFIRCYHLWSALLFHFFRLFDILCHHFMVFSHA